MASANEPGAPGGHSLGPAGIAAAAAIGLLMAFPSLPGRMNGDAINMFEQALRGGYSDWHVTLVSWLWNLSGAGSLAVAALTLVTAAVILVSFAILFASAGLGRWPAVAAAAALAALPPVLGYLAAVSKDTWFAAIVLAMLVLSAVGRPGRLWARAALAGLGVVMRPEVVLLIPVFALAETYIFSGSWRRGAGFAAIAAAVVALNFLFVYQVAKAERLYPQSVIFLFDLAGISIKTDTLLLPPAAFPAQDLEVLKRHFWFDSVAPMIWGEPKEEMLGRVRGDDVSDLQRRWIAAIIAHPREYLSTRAGVIGTFLKGIWQYHPGIDPNPNISLYWPPWNDAVNAYVAAAPKRLMSHSLPMAGAAVLALWLALRRRATRWDRAVLAYLAIGLVYQLMLLVLMVAPDFRFGYGGVVLFYLVLALTLVREREAVAALIAWLRRRRPSGA